MTSGNMIYVTWSSIPISGVIMFQDGITSNEDYIFCSGHTLFYIIHDTSFRYWMTWKRYKVYLWQDLLFIHINNKGKMTTSLTPSFSN